MFSLFAAMLVAVFGLLAIAGGMRLVSRIPRNEVESGMSSAQLDRLESALGALEARMDDLQDQQRFLERLVAERPEPGSLPAPGGPQSTETSGPRDENEAGGSGGAGSILLEREARDG